MNVPALPIDPFLPHIVDLVKRSPLLILQAEPGAGKTTRVPVALMQAALGDVYVLEPRRLAARMAARRVAQELGEEVGESVGYQVRFEEVSSKQTKLWFCTEGVLTRRLLSGDRLGKAGVVVLDEFHERHLETDLALALLRKLGQKVVLMSATLSARIADHPVLQVPGRTFPVAVEYTPASAAALEEQVAGAVSAALKRTDGHVLVFLPGAAEIRKASAACTPVASQYNAKTLALHGDLSPQEQDEAVAPSRQRKIICSTNVAESSVTIEGVTAVVDSGLARVATHSPWSGISRLQVEKISRSSAVQRSGRAGRTGPGLAIRLYPESDFVRRPEDIAPEILRADLTQLSLQLAANGLAWEAFEWIDQPAEAAREHAREVLEMIGALDRSGKITADGRRMSRMPVHPRLARLAMESGRAGSELAARLSEGRLRLEEAARGNQLSDVDALLAQRCSYEARRLRDQISPHVTSKRGLDQSLLLAFPDRVARKRGETLLLSTGASARLDAQSAVRSEFLLAIEVGERDGERALVRIAHPIEPDWLLELFPDKVTASEDMIWNREAERVEQVNAMRYDRLIIDESRSAPTNAGAAAEMLCDKALGELHRFVDQDGLEAFLKRLRFATQHGVKVDLPEGELLRAAVRILCDGLSSFKELSITARDNALLSILAGLVPMQMVDEVAPSHVLLPRGRRARIDYHDGRSPSVASRLQDFFGMAETPAIARGAVPVVVELLAPNHRPVQVTMDLASFWRNLYPQVRKELSRRYPKHLWPERPV